MSQKKFIIVQSKEVANKMIDRGFHLISTSYGTYTFVNDPPKNFNFDSIDMQKVHFTDKLCL